MPNRLSTFAAAAFVAAAFVALAPASARACQPCESKLDLPRSLAKAELVVVARRAAGPRQPEGPDGGPPCDELAVEAVLKGDFEGERLWVRSFHGMCPYGIILGGGSYVVLLGRPSADDRAYHTADLEGECKAALGRKDGFYVAVELGCAVKSLKVESGAVEAEGVKMTLEEFGEKYGLRAAGRGAAAGRRSGAWPGGNFGAGLFGPAARSLEVTK